ncbi:hypothetical protein [Trinickia symbiotica]|uniref:hypothetical protein n=1 Tax=Trinickia symbiotica TaxID=863227 RepID=UPI0011AF1B7A|nr:hypothetical protein [Trinickia symbiotica]
MQASSATLSGTSRNAWLLAVVLIDSLNLEHWGLAPHWLLKLEPSVCHSGQSFVERMDLIQTIDFFDFWKCRIVHPAVRAVPAIRSPFECAPKRKFFLTCKTQSDVIAADINLDAKPNSSGCVGINKFWTHELREEDAALTRVAPT